MKTFFIISSALIIAISILIFKSYKYQEECDLRRDKEIQQFLDCYEYGSRTNQRVEVYFNKCFVLNEKTNGVFVLDDNGEEIKYLDVK